MKRNWMVWSSAVTVAGSLLLGALPSNAATVAWWRFEEGPAGAQVPHPGPDGVWSADVPDSSGNNNALSVWNAGGSGYKFTTDLPYQVDPATGAPNNFSVKNSGGGPAMWNESLKTWSPSAWTVEAAFKPENGGYRTIVGRDSRGAVSNDANLAAMYFQLIPGNAVAIKYADVSGVWHEAISAPGVVQGFDWPTDHDGLLGKWYTMAAVSDGSTLSLYLNNLSAGSGYQLVARTDMTTSGSANTALTPGMGDGGDWDAGNFSVGRGLYAGGHGDRAYGFIDEVRLSDTALGPDQFLAPIPEPGTMALVLLGGLPLLRRRMRR